MERDQKLNCNVQNMTRKQISEYMVDRCMDLEEKDLLCLFTAYSNLLTSFEKLNTRYVSTLEKDKFIDDSHYYNQLLILCRCLKSMKEVILFHTENFTISSIAIDQSNS